MTDVVYLVDVDNTLLDNDAVIVDLRAHLRDAFGVECERRYWEIFEGLRRELGYADYLGALQRYRVENPRDSRLLRISPTSCATASSPSARRNCSPTDCAR